MIMGKMNKGKGLKRLSAIFFTIILLCSAMVNMVSMNIDAADIYEPDDSPAEATTIPTDGSSQSHDFDPAGDEDWVNFTVIVGTVYTIETVNLSASVDTYIYLYESNGITIIDQDDDGGVGLASRIVWNSTGYSASFCYVRVRELGADGGPGYDYDLRIYEGTGAEFSAPHSDYGLDTDSDTLFNYLVLEVTVNVFVAEDYRIGGGLYDSSWNFIGNIWNNTFLSVGIHIVELRFIGWEIYQNSDNGTYNVTLEIRDSGWNIHDSEDYMTSLYNYDEFQPPPATFTGNFIDYGLDTDSDLFYDFLVIMVEVEVVAPGNFYVELDLHHNATGNHIVQNTSVLTFLPTGTQVVIVYLDGMVIRQSGYDGPYKINSLWLFDEDWNNIEYLNDPYVTAAYTWSEFQPLPATFEPPHSDYGLDTDSDVLYNYLVVEVMVNVVKAGDYEIRGMLYNSTGSWMDTLYNYTYLAVGIQTVEIWFEGWRIYNNGDNGSYDVNLRLEDDVGKFLDSDSHTTNFYTYDEFQPPPAAFEPPHSDYGLDTDGDTYYNFLVINAAVNVTVAGFYYVSGWLYDSFWNNIVYDSSNTVFLNVGSQILELRYTGIDIYNHGENGTFYVDMDLRDDFGNTLDSETYTTSSYFYDEFQPPPATFEPPHSDYGLDTDSDFYYNFLVVNVTVNVSSAGFYRVSGWLYDSFWNSIDYDSSNTFLNVGSQIVELRYAGVSIFFQGENGPYYINLELRDDFGNNLDSETYTTSSYLYDEFQPPTATFEPPHSDYGLDTDSDFYYNFLVVQVIVNVSSPGNYEIRGELRDSIGNYIENRYNNTFLAVGIQTVEIRFIGWRIFNNYHNGFYNVDLWLRDDSSNTIDTDSYTTSSYFYDEFQPPPAALDPPHSDYGLDTDSDFYYNYLIINVAVNVSSAGNYRVSAWLYDIFWNNIEYESNNTFLNVGSQIVELRYDGVSIFNHGVNGPYYVNLDLRDDSGNTLESDTYTTSSYLYDEFQPPPAKFEPPHSDYGLDTDSDTYYNFLVVEVVVNVSSPGNYELRGELRDSLGNYIENKYNYTFLAAGIQTVELRFEGWKIYSNGDNGSYIVNLWLRDDSFNTIDTDTYTTSSYTYDEFQPPPAMFEPPHSDYGLDTDSDIYYNFLVVNVMVKVTGAGFYDIRGWLYDSFWNNIVYDSNYTFLNVGLQIVELRYEGLSINLHGENGPYYLDLEIRDDFGNYLDYDTYTTNSYMYDEFQPPSALFEPPHSDYGIDTDSDTFYNFLVVEVEVNVSSPGNYEIRGRLFDSLWNHIENRYNNTFLNTGIQTVELRFEGWRIYSNGDNGSYNVELRLRDGSFITIDTDTYTTNSYTYDEFQRPPAIFAPPHTDYGLDTDSDTLFDYLIVEIMVDVSVAGDYILEGYLLDSFFNNIEYDSNYTFLNTGIQIVELRFEGWRIYNNGVDGPFTVDLYIYDQSWNRLDSDTYTTSSYTYLEFQPPAATFAPPHSDYGLDTDSDSYYNYLIVEVEVNVNTAGDFEIRGELRDSLWNYIENIYNYTFLAAGIQTVELRFEGWRIFNRGDNGSYNVDLRLRDDSSNTLDTDTYSTNIYTFDEFQPPPALFSPPHSDYGLDTDSDSLFDYLVVEVTVDVSVADNYQIEAYLYDGSWNYINDDYNYTFLNVGIQVVELRFDGWMIYINGEDGPYNIELNIYDASWNWMDSDTHLTGAYIFTQFEVPALFEPPHSDLGLDTDSDSLFNYLVVNVVVNVSVSGFYYVSGMLYDGLSAFIDQNGKSTYLTTGIHTVELRFLGYWIYSNGENGPYTVDLDLYDDFSNLLDSDAHLTSVYMFPEFQPPPPPIIPPYFNDFEGVGSQYIDDDDNVNFGTSWELGDPTSYPQGPGGAYSSTNCMGTNLLSEYQWGADIFLYMPVLNLTSVSVTDLTFWHWYNIDASWEDGGFLEISTDSGLSWSLLNPVGGYPVVTESGVPGYMREVPCYGGVSGGWVMATFDLSSYSGQVIIIRFRFWSEPWNENGYPGWYIDDVNIAVVADPTPPADITDLSVIGTTANSATLTWTAPGDDGMSGTAAGYEIRYSTTGPINSANWLAATTFSQSWTPLLGGSTETHDVTGLSEGTQYWFAIITADEVPNWSGVSNSPSGTTPDITPP
jgi:hypothetical protein